jgi:hypothetical protein
MAAAQACRGKEIDEGTPWHVTGVAGKVLIVPVQSHGVILAAPRRCWPTLWFSGRQGGAQRPVRRDIGRSRLHQPLQVGSERPRVPQAHSMGGCEPSSRCRCLRPRRPLKRPTSVFATVPRSRGATAWPCAQIAAVAPRLPQGALLRALTRGATCPSGPIRPSEPVESEIWVSIVGPHKIWLLGKSTKLIQMVYVRFPIR